MMGTEDTRNMEEFYDVINVGYSMHLIGGFIRNLSRCKVTWT